MMSFGHVLEQCLTCRLELKSMASNDDGICPDKCYSSPQGWEMFALLLWNLMASQVVLTSWVKGLSRTTNIRTIFVFRCQGWLELLGEIFRWIPLFTEIN